MKTSMTGYGRGGCSRSGRRIVVEIKSVNHRFLDFSLEAPSFFYQFEDDIRIRLEQTINRGKLTVWVQYESSAQKDNKVNINNALADAYMGALTGFCSRYSLEKLSSDALVPLMANRPDIITFDKFDSALSSDEDRQEVSEILNTALDEAICELKKMRDREGAALIKDIEKNRQEASDIVKQTAALIPEIQETHVARLRERVAKMVARMGQVPDEVRFATEVAVLADKICISEEIVRLESHLDQMDAYMKRDGPIGRKLDFLIQELVREANTLGAKSKDISTTKMVVELKCLIEKMREQVQNIE